MAELDLEKLKQELDDVSGGSRYDFDEIMREAGSETASGSGNSLEELMRSLGVDVDAPQTENTSAAATQVFAPADDAALLRASEQTQLLIEEQDDLAGQPEKAELDPLEEQDNVFSQLFARLGEIEKDEQEPVPTDPRLTEPEDEPELMDRLFGQSEPDMDEGSDLESVLDAATERFLCVEEDESDEDEELDEEEFDDEEEDDFDEEEFDEDEEEEETPKKGFLARFFGASDDEEEELDEDEEDDEYDEESEDDTEDDLEEYEDEEVDEDDLDEEEFDEDELEDEEEEEAPKKGFLARFFGASDDEEEADEEEYDSDEEPEDAADEGFLARFFESVAEEPENEEEAAEEADDSTQLIERLDMDETQLFDVFAEQATQKITVVPEEEAFAPAQAPEEEAFAADIAEVMDEIEEEHRDEQLLQMEEIPEEEPEISEKETFAADIAGVMDELEQDAEAEPEVDFLTQFFAVPMEEEPEEIEEPEEEPEEIEEPEESDEEDDLDEDIDEDEEDEDTNADKEEKPRFGLLNKIVGALGLEIVEENIAEESDEEDEEDIDEEDSDDIDDDLDEESEEFDEEAEDLESDEEESEPEEVEEPEEESEPEEPKEIDFGAFFEEIEENADESEEEPAEPQYIEHIDDDEDDAEDEPELPQPRPEDTPVISEEELAAFLSDVDAEEETKRTSFEQLLRDSGVEVDIPEPEELPVEEPTKKLVVEKIAQTDNAGIFEVPLRTAEPKAEAAPQKPAVFDIEAKLAEDAEPTAEQTAEPEQVPAAELEELPAANTTDSGMEAMILNVMENLEETDADNAEQERDPDPAWMSMPLEDLFRIAPDMEDLRQDGPVMTREVLRQKEWIMERIRRYHEEENRASMPEEELAEEPTEEQEPILPQEPAGISVHADAVQAAKELNALLQQDGDESVFPDRSTGKPETEAVDRKETIIEIITEEQDSLPEALQAAEEAPAAEALADEPAKPEEKKEAKASARRRKKAKPRPVQPKVPRNPDKEQKEYRRRAKRQARCSIVLALLTLFCIYISCAPDIAVLPLPNSLSYAYNPTTVLTVILGCMGAGILLAYDVVRDGIRSLMHRSPNLSALVVLAVLLNALHCVVRMVNVGEEIPYACVAMLALFTQLRAQVSHSTIKHYSLKIAASAKQPMGLFYHDGSVPHIVKAPLPDTNEFVEKQTWQDERERLEMAFVVLVIAVAAVLSAIVCVATGDIGRFIYVLAATVTGACQIALLSAAVTVRKNSARRMQRSGAAAEQSAGIAHMALAEAVVVTDEELFPIGSIALEKLELRSNLNDSTALAYAAALTGGTSLGAMLAEEVRTRYGSPLIARQIIRETDGGISGQVGGMQVLLGSDRFLAERGVVARDVPENGIVLALDGSVAAVFVITYRVPASMFNAMQLLVEQKVKIWLSSRNYQITPKLVEQKYGLKEGTVAVPETEIDRGVHDPAYVRQDILCGVLARDSFVGMIECIAAARAEEKTTRGALVFSACAALVSMLLMAYLCFVFVPSDARPIRMLIYMILCFIPIFFLENGISKD